MGALFLQLRPTTPPPFSRAFSPCACLRFPAPAPRHTPASSCPADKRRPHADSWAQGSGSGRHTSLHAYIPASGAAHAVGFFSRWVFSRRGGAPWTKPATRNASILTKSGSAIDSHHPRARDRHRLPQRLLHATPRSSRASRCLVSHECALGFYEASMHAS
jgi:hypothetical protein